MLGKNLEISETLLPTIQYVKNIPWNFLVFVLSVFSRDSKLSISLVCLYYSATQQLNQLEDERKTLSKTLKEKESQLSGNFCVLSYVFQRKSYSFCN